MEKTIEFRAMSKNYHLHISPELPYFDQNRIARMIPARIITFSQSGVYQTSDPVVIEAIRNSTAFKAKRVIEITDGDKALFERVRTQTKAVRGVITAASIQEEAGLPQSPEVPKGITLEEKRGAACEICGKSFPDDPQGRKLRMHKVNHRVSRPPEK